MGKCSWCGGYVESESEKFEQTFCSLKCADEYVSKGYKLEEKQSGCFIATAVYGSYDHDVVYDLRLFRDNWLKHRAWGNKFIHFYYQQGPKLANVIRHRSALKSVTRIILIKPLHYIVTGLKLHNER